MGEVWLAEVHLSVGVQRKVALKFLKGSGLADHLFTDEVAVLAQLHHPNVVQLFDSGEHEETAWYAMEWIPGQNVLSLLKRATPRGLPIAVALSVALDVCDGLRAAHEAMSADGRPLGIVHRDVAPANVVVTSTGLCKLIDFGIAVSSMRRASVTESGFVRGRIGYLSPERLLQEPVDGRSDQWSLAVMLFEMVSGRRLYATGDATGSIRLILETAPDLSAVPPALKEVLSRMLQHEPSQRFASMGEVRKALEAAAISLGVAPSHSVVREYIESADAVTDLHGAPLASSGATNTPVLTSSLPRPSWRLPLSLAGSAALGLSLYFLVPLNAPSTAALPTPGVVAPAVPLSKIELPPPPHPEVEAPAVATAPASAEDAGVRSTKPKKTKVSRLDELEPLD
jgi:serine/threonine protein kinase